MMERAETRFGTTDVPPREASEADVWEAGAGPDSDTEEGRVAAPTGGAE